MILASTAGHTLVTRSWKRRGEVGAGDVTSEPHLPQKTRLAVTVSDLPERTARSVNQRVVSSSPTSGAIWQNSRTSMREFSLFHAGFLNTAAPAISATNCQYGFSWSVEGV